MDKLKFSHKVLIATLIIILLSFSIQSNKILFYPSSINIVKGENKNLNVAFPFFLDINQEKENVVEASLNGPDSKGLKKSYDLNGVIPGNTEIQLKLLGFIPVKNYNINVVDRPMLIPGGNAIGVRLNTKGVLIVAVTDVIGADGKRTSPAKTAGLKVGDSILKINEIEIKDAEHVVEILNEVKSSKIKILIQRNKGEFVTETVPIQSIQDNCYRLGIWVRDKTSGIGTLTYLDYNNDSFGALGHGIVDLDTGDLLPVDNGKIMNANISKIEQGKKGLPGEIRGVFYETDNVIGNIDKNCDFGIYGNINENYLRDNLNQPVPIGFKEEIKEGKAYILSTLEGDKIDKFEVEITKLESQSSAKQKSMILKVTDEKLLNKTGGIVQGMSGSPIIQDDKLIGAITHVFVNDPTKGYGLYIEWMLQQKDKP